MTSGSSEVSESNNGHPGNACLVLVTFGDISGECADMVSPGPCCHRPIHPDSGPAELRTVRIAFGEWRVLADLVATCGPSLVMSCDTIPFTWITMQSWTEQMIGFNMFQ